MLTALEASPIEVRRGMVHGHSTAVLASLRTISCIFRDSICLPEVMVDVTVRSSGVFVPPLPSRLPHAERKHLRMNLDRLEDLNQIQRVTSSLSASASALAGINTLYLCGSLQALVSCMQTLADSSGCLARITHLDLVVQGEACMIACYSSAEWHTHSDNLLAILTTLSSLQALTLVGLPITFLQLNSIGELPLLTSISATSTIWHGAQALRLPRILRLYLQVSLTSRAVCMHRLFEGAFPALTHLTLVHQRRGSTEDIPFDSVGSNSLMLHILSASLCVNLQSLVFEAHLSAATLAALAELPHLVSLRAIGFSPMPQDDVASLTALTSLRCSTFFLEQLQYTPNITCLEILELEDYVQLNTLPHQITSLRVQTNALGKDAHFDTVSNLRLVVEDYTPFLTAFPMLVELGLDGEESDYRTLGRYLDWLAGNDAPPISSLTLSNWSVSASTVPRLVLLAPHLRRLTLEHCRLTTRVVRDIVQGLPGLLRLDVIRCSGTSEVKCRDIAYSAALAHPGVQLAMDSAFRLVCNNRSLTTEMLDF